MLNEINNFLVFIGDQKLYLQKTSEFAVPIRNVSTFFPFFLISKSTYDIAESEKSSVDVNTYITKYK